MLTHRERVIYINCVCKWRYLFNVAILQSFDMWRLNIFRKVLSEKQVKLFPNSSYDAIYLNLYSAPVTSILVIVKPHDN